MARKFEITAFVGTSSDMSRADIELADEHIFQLFNVAFDGYCPVCCDNEISKDEVVCCDCLDRAVAYHRDTCGCLR